MLGRGKGNRWKWTAIALLAAALLLLPACETMPERASSGAASAAPASSAPEPEDGAVQGGGPVNPTADPVLDQGGEATYRVEEYTLREDNLELSITYPQLEGTRYEQVNALLRERGMQTAELLRQEEEKRRAALAASSAAEPASSGEQTSSRTASSQPEAPQDRMLTLMGGSQCYLPTADFVSVSFTMDITDSTREEPSREWYTLNYDLRGNMEVTCADLFADLDGLADALYAQVGSGTQENALVTYLTKDRLRAGLPGVPVAFGMGFAEFGYPVPHAAGDVVLISLPLSVASAYRSDNTLWEVIGTS